MSAVMLSVISGRGVMGSPVKQAFLYNTMEEAKEVFDKLVQATKDWEERTNDRERYFTFKYLLGEACVCLSETLTYEIEDPFGEHAEVLRDWNAKIGELHRLSNPTVSTIPL